MLLQYLIIFVGVMFFMHVALEILGALIYDFRAVAADKELQRNPNARRFRSRPAVSIIVHCQDNQADIENCLKSIVASSYRKLQIVVVDAHSRDKSRHIIKQFMIDHPKRDIRLFARRSTQGLITDCHAAFQRYGNGELTLVCEAADLFEAQTISRAIQSYNAFDTPRAIALNQRLISRESFGNMLRRYYGFARRRHLKATAWMTQQQQGMSVGILYPSNQVASIFSDQSNSIHACYNANANLWRRKISSSGTMPKRSMLIHLYRIFQSSAVLFSPVVLGYSVYVALRVHQSSLLLTEVLGLGVYVIHAIGNDAATPLRQKVLYIAGLPVIVGPSVIALCIAGIKSVYGLRQLLTRGPLYTLSST